MTAVNPEASRQAVVEAALVLLERMGLSPADLAGVPRIERLPVGPSFAGEPYDPMAGSGTSLLVAVGPGYCGRNLVLVCQDLKARVLEFSAGMSATASRRKPPRSASWKRNRVCARRRRGAR